MSNQEDIILRIYRRVRDVVITVFAFVISILFATEIVVAHLHHRNVESMPNCFADGETFNDTVVLYRRIKD